MAKKSKGLPELDRIASMRNHAKDYIHDDLKGLYTIYARMSLTDLLAKYKDPHLTSAEKMVVKSIINSLTAKDAKGLDSTKYVHEKTFGKPSDVIRIGGINDDAVRVNVEKDTENALDKLDEKALKALETVLLGTLKKKK
jgi:hypothetical protein